MPAASQFVIPPGLPAPQRPLPPFKALWMSTRNNLSTWPQAAYEETFWRARFFGRNVILINEPEAIRHILSGAAEKYQRPVMVKRILRPLIGDGLFLAEGADWRRQRRQLSPLFTPASIALLIPHFKEAAAHLLRRLERRPQANLARTFQDTALEVVLRALFSCPDADQRERLGGVVRSYLTSGGRPNPLDVFATKDSDFRWATWPRALFRRRWNAAIDELVAARREMPNQGARDLLDLLLSVRDAETGEGLADAEIRDQCATMLVAGFETTARLMFWCSYLLALDPAEQQRIRDELTGFSPERLVLLDDLGHWPLLRQTMLEAMRLYPPAPHIVRDAVAEDRIGDLIIAPGTQVWISPWILHRHRKYWDNPDAFIPERFAGKPAPWSGGAPYMPFGAGSRTCIGAIFAMSEAQIVLAEVLSRFRLTLVDSRPVLPIAAVTVAPSYEPLFKVEKV
jgi:cytochrome P450